MRKIVTALFIVVFVGAFSSNAQVSFGIKGGLNISNVHFNKDIIDSDNLTGFQVGPMMEVNIPFVGIGLETAILYSQKGLQAENEDGKNENFKTDFLEVPLNFKWKFGLPVFKGYFAAGPYAGFRIGGDKVWDMVSSQVKQKNYSVGLNFGAGVELLRHLQVGANYSLGLTDNYSGVVGRGITETVNGKNRGWAITAAILF
jgi:hypothetical protein